MEPFPQRILQNLHSAEQGVSKACPPGENTQYSGLDFQEILRLSVKCSSCQEYSTSQPPPQSTTLEIPDVPFEMIFSDYFKLHSKYHLIIGYRLSGWTEVFQVQHGGENSGFKVLCSTPHRVFATFGIPREISSDGGSELIASATQDLLNRSDSHHRLPSAYNPQSNGRAEVAIKDTKRLLEKNQVVQALL